MRALITRAKAEGYITFDDLNEVMPLDANVDEWIAALEREGVALVPHRPGARALGPACEVSAEP
jgi:hypothetical protein